MNFKQLDFIGMYDNVFPDGFCNHLISEFERYLNNGSCGNRQDSEGITKTRKNDDFYFLNLRNHVFSDFNEVPTMNIFMTGLQNCFDQYADQYDVLRDMELKCTSVKMQKTSPGGGYHIWHSEQGNGESANRCLVYSIYLNDIDDAGETEFLYQKLRIPPKENTGILWPAAFTHTHRGNVVHGNTPKYIITGWFYLE
jgi:hypothetical protein